MALASTLYKGEKVGVLGMGRTGLAVARALQAGGAEPICWDDGAAGQKAAREAGFEVLKLSEPSVMGGLALLITSPGIPHLYPTINHVILAAMKAGVPVDNDIGLFFAELEAHKARHSGAGPRVVAITGSNGKSTTTALIHHCLKSAGVDAHLGGNIGSAVFNLPPFDKGQVIVLELSSYQTELARQMAADIAVFTNLSPDHLDRHNGMGGYFAAKKRLFEISCPSLSVIGVDETEGLYLANGMLSEGRKVASISPRQDLSHLTEAVFMRDGALTVVEGGKLTFSLSLASSLGLQGAHNHQNACAATAALFGLGMGEEEIARGFETFSGLPHRMQRVGERGGVLFVNDSKATNADAAEKSLSTFENIRWIAGGVAKEGGIESLAPLFSRIKKAYLIGEAAGEFAETLKRHNVALQISESLAKAIEQANSDAETGDVVLLAPACASFDQFKSFEERGEQFVKGVALISRVNLLQT